MAGTTSFSGVPPKDRALLRQRAEVVRPHARPRPLMVPPPPPALDFWAVARILCGSHPIGGRSAPSAGPQPNFTMIAPETLNQIETIKKRAGHLWRFL
jgi:hypothetical protein